jgi:hypothetical protein
MTRVCLAALTGITAPRTETSSTCTRSTSQKNKRKPAVVIPTAVFVENYAEYEFILVYSNIL